MSDNYSTPSSHDADDSNQAAEQALELLERSWDPQAETRAASQETLVGLESLALMAYDLTPVAPRPEARGALLAAVRSQATATIQAAGDGPSRSDSPSIRRPISGETSLPPDLAGPAAAAIPFREPSPAPAWTTLALAAGLAFCLVGMGYLYGQINAKDAVIALQQQRLEEVPSLESEAYLLRSELRTVQDRLNMVDTVARQAYPMRAVANIPGPVRAGESGGGLKLAMGGPGAKGPSGRVYVCGAHQQWYLTLTGLEPSPAGKEYRLWFMTEDGPVDGGRLEIEDGHATMRDLAMPQDTEGFRITLEPANGGDAPVGQLIMIGDDPISL